MRPARGSISSADRVVERGDEAVPCSAGAATRPDHTIARIALAFAAALLLTASLARAQATAEMDAYRRFARTPESGALLIAARRAMEGATAATAAPDTRAASAATTAPDGRAVTDSANSADTLAWPGSPAGLYISLVHGKTTRACVGSPTPPRGSLAESVRTLARLALTADPRRPPVRRDELPELRIVISFTNAGRRVASPYEVDPGREGLLVGSARGHVAYLPGEARTVQWALREARRAGVLAGESDAQYRRLDVVTLSEPISIVPSRRDKDALP